jgi:hypothetical protein
MFAEGETGLQGAGIGLPWFFAGLTAIARYVVAGRALVGFWGGEPLRLDEQPRAWRHVRGAVHAKE